MYVKPVAGRLIRDPQSLAPVPEAGRDVPETAYWLRAVAHGDLVLAEPPASSSAPVPEAGSESAAVQPDAPHETAEALA